MSEFSRKWKK